jgi:AraC-like DNA-binding protein
MRKTPFPPDYAQRLARATENFLDDCYRRQQPARAKDFAKALDLTPQYVSRLGTKVLGSKLHVYLRQKQLAYAARLLKTTPLDIEEIASRCGFGTRSTMNRGFVAHFGMSSAAFRGFKK